MLKIKDDVDLEILKDYGFEENTHKNYIGEDKDGNDLYGEEYFWYSKTIELMIDSETGYKIDAGLSCSEKDRRITKLDRYNPKYKYEFFKKYTEDTLYDLIKADLVEKVE